MKAAILLLILLGSSNVLLAQTKFIEVAVNEPVDLEVVCTRLIISIQSEDYQRENAIIELDDDGLEESYPEAYMYYGEDYDDLSAKERKKREEAYEAALLDWEARYAAYSDRMEDEEIARMNNWPVFYAKHAMDSLRMAGFDFTMRTNNEIEIDEEYMFNADTQLVLQINSREEYGKVMALFEEISYVQFEADKPEYAPIESKYESVLPVLTERANVQANILAKSIQKKLGSIQQISNVHPGFSSAFIEAQHANSQSVYNSLMGVTEEGNPFDTPKKVWVEFIFRFELLP